MAPGDTSATQIFYVASGTAINELDHVIKPEGNRINFKYDDNGNLQKISDGSDINSGNGIIYTYDSDGNQREDIKDANGALQKSLSYTYDALDRIKRNR